MGKGAYKDGVKEGHWIEYYQNGVLRSEENYVKGLQEGEKRKFSKDGRLSAETSFLHGNVVGSSRKYGVDEKLFAAGEYKNGVVISNETDTPRAKKKLPLNDPLTPIESYMPYKTDVHNNASQ